MNYPDAFFICCLLIYAATLLVLTYGLRHPARASNTRTPLVSVVVAARNESANLPALLADLAAQTYARYEVIIVDDRSTDDTPRIVNAAIQQYSQALKLIEQHTVPEGLSPKKMALQKGVAASQGEIVLLTDADCRVRAGWIAAMVKVFTEDVALGLGYSEIVARTSSSGWLKKLFDGWQSFEFATLVANMAASANLHHPFGASGQNLAVTRRAFDAVGGYSSVMHRIAGDDMLLLALIKNARVGRVVYVDDEHARNRSYVVASWRKLRHQRARWASSGTHHFGDDKLFMVYAVGNLALNMLLLFGALWARFDFISWHTWMLCIAAKFCLDVLFYATALARFKRLAWLRWLPVWFVTQPLYLLMMAWWGQRGRFVWKDTEVKN